MSTALPPGTHTTVLGAHTTILTTDQILQIVFNEVRLRHGPLSDFGVVHLMLAQRTKQLNDEVLQDLVLGAIERRAAKAAGIGWWLRRVLAWVLTATAWVVGWGLEPEAKAGAQQRALDERSKQAAVEFRVNLMQVAERAEALLAEGPSTHVRVALQEILSICRLARGRSTQADTEWLFRESLDMTADRLKRPRRDGEA